MEINGATSVTGILGYPIEHTLSPAIQNAAFRESGLNWVYLPFNVHPTKISEALLGLAACECRGLNVTMPHKKVVFDLMDKVEESALIFGAVNTVEFVDGQMIGHNTDGLGFLKSLEVEASFDPNGKRVLIIGAGASAHSIALSLASAGAAQIKLLNRTPEKAENIIRLVKSRFEGCAASIEDMRDTAQVVNCDLIVNATSVGMDINRGLPFSLDLLESGQIVFDVIYDPPETEFLKVARGRGARAMNGAGMLLYQGAAAFSIWTGLPAPIKSMAAALELALIRDETEETSAANKQPNGKDYTRREAGHTRSTERSQGD
ncbi:MAG TPA: shikimate dehydrogenase [Actinobacteria bacterium]|nr:shikimate dehydrogenase [Actinomycetota bacterium]